MKAWYFKKAWLFLCHRVKSFHLHGIHSPFIFQLQRDCFKDRTYYDAYKTLDDYVLRFRESKISISIVDHGAGSAIFKSNRRQVKDIVKYNSSSIKDAQLLFRLAQYFNAQTVLELGTSLGVASTALGLSKAQVTTVEGSESIYRQATSAFDHFKLNNITCINSQFTNFLCASDSKIKYDLIYIDGHHNENATLDYFEKCLAFSNDNTVIILDDIYWSAGMYNAWNKLIKHNRVTASVNLFYKGLLFIRPQQLQEQFYISL